MQWETSTSRADQKLRLQDLCDLAQHYRGWSAKQLASHLGRDVHNVIPPSGTPKVDLVVRLADALDWPGQDVLDALAGDYVKPVPQPRADETWESLDRAAHQAILEGRFHDAVDLAVRELSAGRSADQRAQACHREMTAWDGMGRYRKAIEACRRALQETGLSSHVSVALELNLALFHHLLGDHPEAKGMALALIESLSAGDASTEDPAGTLGFARYVLGSTHRVLAGADPSVRDRSSFKAITELSQARVLLRESAGRSGLETLAGVADVCDGGILEMQVMRGEVSPRSAIDACLERLESAVDPRCMPSHLREAIAWWCIFGCNIAARHLSDSAELERTLAVLTNKADEIADLTENWVLRERVWTFELARRRAASAQAGREAPWVIDRDDARQIAGAMSRFPLFRETGWQVLRESRIIRAKEA